MSAIELKGNELKATVRGVLDRHQLGAARMVAHGDEVYVVLEEDRGSHITAHLAIADLEKATGRQVQIKIMSDLHPSELARVQQQATSV